ncbi:hypothetical protein [Bradyrhizobium algeriense]|uniref:hypothetical protein n=1 Tax=Bradyrhizobium algeriense TaxID=634784 RepID=UPI000D37EA4A|nr:hypothetical protein [Bradyrhizobium algeriense]
MITVGKKADPPVLRVLVAWLSCPFCIHGQTQETHQAPKRGNPRTEPSWPAMAKQQGRERCTAIS